LSDTAIYYYAALDDCCPVGGRSHPDTHCNKRASRDTKPPIILASRTVRRVIIAVRADRKAALIAKITCQS
jgi:hypothetical protein